MSPFNNSSSFLHLLLLFSLCISSAFSTSKTPTKIGQGYRLISLEESQDGGILGLLQIKEKNNMYGQDIPLLQLYVKHETENRLRVHITDANTQRWEVPYDLLARDEPPGLRLQQNINWSKKIIQNGVININTKLSEYSGNELIFSLTTDPFNFIIKRKSNNQILFNSTPDKSDHFNELVFKDQYLEITTKLPKDASIYGLGENTQPHGIKLYPNDPYTLYTTDASAINLNTDLYGSHPMYMDLRNVNGQASTHAVLLLNSNGMDVFYRGDSLTYKIIGGVLDFYFFSGPSPLEVVDQYTTLVGRPAAMPYWSFGFHQCRWGYHNLSVVKDVVKNYKKAKIPLDVIWNDDDHMDGHKDFTLNPISYPRSKLFDFVTKIHAKGMKYIVLIDPGIGVNKTYGVYQRGISKDVFIKYEGKPYLAQVWPGAVNFPDYLNPKTVEWWGDEIRRFHQLVPVDGLWIDMNEASNFCSGLCTIPQDRICPNGTGPGWICCLDCKNITKTRWDDPPYKINASGSNVPIGYKTIATSAVHYNGVKEYDAHSLYGFSQSIATHKALQGLQGKRPFILSRSTFVGAGRYAAHWTGDNKGTWDDLKYSISTMLNFGIFGVPMVGSDICGFYPAPTEELCNRWIEVGAFYPFSRDHANFYSPRQELYQWKSVAESARNALGMRYKLLPYLYTLSYEAHTSGAPIARPLFFTFPALTQCYELSTQFLIGSNVMVSPVLEPNTTKVKAFFPAGSWYNLFDMTQAIVSKQPHYVTLDAPLHVVNVHLYQNAILPMQQGGTLSKKARATPFTLVVAFPVGAVDAEASGKIFLDDDELPEMKLGNGYSTYIKLYGRVSNGTVKIWSDVEEGEFAVEKGLIIEKVRILGIEKVRVLGSNGIGSGIGSGSGFGIEVEGNQISDVSNVRISQTKLNYDLENEEEIKRNMMVEISGLNLLVGKEFIIMWGF